MQTAYSEESTWLGERLKMFREQQKITQDEMAKACGLSKNYISALERGINKCSVQTLMGYCNKLNKTPNELLGVSSQGEIDPELSKLLSVMDAEQQKKVLNVIRAIL